MAESTVRTAGTAPRGLLRTMLAAVPRGGLHLSLATFLAALASAAAVGLMATSAWLLSRAAEHPPVLYLQVAAVGVRFFGISRGVFRYTERLVGHDLALKLQSNLRIHTYDRLSRTTLLGRRRGDLLTRIVADVEAIQDLVVRVLIPACAASVVIVATTTLFAVFSLPAAVTLLVSAILAGVAFPLLAQRLSQAADAATVPGRGRLADKAHEISRAATDLVAYGVTEAKLAGLLEVDADLKRAEEKAAFSRGLATACQTLAAGGAVVGCLIIGGQAVAAGTLPPVMLAVLVLTPLALHEVLSTLTQAAQTYTRAKAALARVEAELAAPPVGAGELTADPAAIQGDGAVVPDTGPGVVPDIGATVVPDTGPDNGATVVPDTGTGVPGIALTDVTIGWPGGEPLLFDLDLRVGPGERVALVGRSGVGKTTVAATVMGLIPAQAGEVAVTGRVGYLAQDAHIFATSLAENVKIGNKDATDDEIIAALARAGLDLSPDRVVGELGATLSGGEARRVALARLLVGDYAVWLLDEPTEHLDEETAAALLADVWEAARAAPTLVITHDPAVIAACDRVVRLER